MYIKNNKVMRNASGVIFAKNRYEITLDVSGTCFPDKVAVATLLSITPRLGNEMYIDYRDGTGVHTYNDLYFLNTALHYYQDLTDTSKIGTIDPNYEQRRKIKINFKFREIVTGFTFQNLTLYGIFPETVGNYKITETLRFSGTNKIEEFPLSFRGINAVSLYLNSATISVLTFIPEWIYNSKIKNLSLLTGFDFRTTPLETNLDKLINIVGLERLSLNYLDYNSVPNNWKDIATLRIIQGQFLFTTLPTNISIISQLTNLSISGADGYNPKFTNWGDGIGLMTNLSTLLYSYCHQDFLPTDLPTGAENCWKLKNVSFGASFRTVERMDAHITSWYNCIDVYGDKTVTVNNKFRKVNFNTFFQLANSFRPTGVFQTPTGFLLGSNNGTPTTPMEMIYVMVTQYDCKFTVLNSASTASQEYKQ